MQTLEELICKYTRTISEEQGFECAMGAILDAIHILGYEWFASELQKPPFCDGVARAAYMHIAYKSILAAYNTCGGTDTITTNTIASILKEVQLIPKLEVLDKEFPHMDFWKKNTFFKDIHLCDEITLAGDLQIIEWFMEDLVDQFYPLKRQLAH